MIFRTNAHGHRTTWVVTERREPTRIGYALVSPERAGTVTVTVGGGGANSAVHVAYDLTALDLAFDHELEAFAAGYARYLQSWEHQIVAAVSGREPQRGAPPPG